MLSESGRLQTMRSLLENAQQEYRRLHDEVERLTAEENIIHKAQQAAVHKRNTMQSVISGLRQVVSAMEQEAQSHE